MITTMTPDSCLRIQGRALFLNGEKLRLFSGAMHYFRTHPAQWADRLAKLKALGLNCIETYVAWNMHEPRPGQFVYDGLADLPAFIRAVADQGMYMIIRPGPYICAEWEFGGLPSWLLAEEGLHLRTSEPRYLKAVDRFFADLLPRILPHAAEAGGHVIAMQVENEYGSYGRDKAYLAHLRQSLRDLGYRGLLFTSEAPGLTMLANGSLPGLWKTVNFGSRAAGAFADLDQSEPGPRMVMEFWNGWFDHWGEAHHTRPAEDAAAALDEILRNDGHVNFYMAHGGTNFGFWNGANTDATGRYQPTVTSYDYDCALTEAGEVTPKYLAFQEVLARYGAATRTPPASRPGLSAMPRLTFRGHAPLFSVLDHLSAPVLSAAPLPMEKLGQATGYVLYRTFLEVHETGKSRALHMTLRDRAHVFVDGMRVAIAARDDAEPPRLDLPKGRYQLDILVENQGRVNYGRHLRDPKGLLGSVWFDYTELTQWQIYPLPLEAPAPEFQPGPAPQDSPAFHLFEFTLSETGDCYLDLPGWTKGVAFLNGFNLGRYWYIGPQRRLYVPWPLLQLGVNRLVLFETDGAGTDCALVTAPDHSGPDRA